MIYQTKGLRKESKPITSKNRKLDLVLQLKVEFQQPFIIQITLSFQIHY